MPRAARYLRAYVQAHRQGARGVDSLLWEDLRAQEVRFEALARNCRLQGRRLLDVGCGRADLLGYLHARGTVPAHYVGLEAQPWLARAARRKRYPNCVIRVADFVRQPEALHALASVVIFSGSLNFLPRRLFYRSLRHAWAATRRQVVFNFLSSPELSGASSLVWHRKAAVVAFARRLGAMVRVDDGYEPGDCTVVMTRPRRRSPRPAVQARNPPSTTRAVPVVKADSSEARKR